VIEAGQRTLGKLVAACKDQFERSMADYDVLLKHDAKNVALFHERGSMKAKMGDQADTDADFRRAVSAGPGAPWEARQTK
jgi:hypothetical protein